MGLAFVMKELAVEANKEIINKLKENDSLMSSGRYIHSYPHSWRSKSPIIFRNTPQWFVDIDKKLNDNMGQFGDTIRQRSLNSIENLVKWTPKTGRTRLLSMISDRPDWVLSRQRVWGVPLPIFTSKKNGEILIDDEVFENIAKIYEKEGSDCWFEENFQRLLGDKYKAEDFNKSSDIVEDWFDSG